ncbi:unnamed protein product, partial [Ectocarpus sp. 12 AP-2014]
SHQHPPTHELLHNNNNSRGRTRTIKKKSVQKIRLSTFHQNRGKRLIRNTAKSRPQQHRKRPNKNHDVLAILRYPKYIVKRCRRRTCPTRNAPPLLLLPRFHPPLRISIDNR